MEFWEFTDTPLFSNFFTTSRFPVQAASLSDSAIHFFLPRSIYTLFALQLFFAASARANKSGRSEFRSYDHVSLLAKLTGLIRSNQVDNMSSQDVVVTLVNQDSDDLDFPGIHKVKRDEEEEEAESASEGDIEIENLVEDGSDTQSGENEGGDSSNVSNITFDVRKRTLIMLWQRTILEEFYRAGMTSASMQLHTLHMAAAEKTGLDCNVVKVCSDSGHPYKLYWG